MICTCRFPPSYRRKKEQTPNFKNTLNLFLFLTAVAKLLLGVQSRRFWEAAANWILMVLHNPSCGIVKHTYNPLKPFLETIFHRLCYQTCLIRILLSGRFSHALLRLVRYPIPLITFIRTSSGNLHGCVTVGVFDSHSDFTRQADADAEKLLTVCDFVLRRVTW